MICWYSITQACQTLCHTMDCSTPGFPVLHSLLEFAQTHVHWVDDTIQPSHPLSPLSPPALNLSQHPVSQFSASGGAWASASASVIPMNIQCWFPLGLTALISLLSKGLSRVFSSTTVQKHQFLFFVALRLLYGSTLHIHNYWKNHSFYYIDLCRWSDVSAF